MFKLESIKIVFLLLIIFACTACKKDSWCKECFERTGKIVTIKRQLTAFNKLNINENINVYITQDTAFEVQLQAGENMLDLFTTEVIDSVLTIKNKNRCNWLRSYKKPFNVFIKMPIVKHIISNTNGTIKSLNTLTTNKTTIDIENYGDVELTFSNSIIISAAKGGGNLILHGNTQYHDCLVKTPSFAYCKDLVSHNTALRAYSTGQCYVNVTNNFEYKITSSGDVFCYGNPSVIFNDSSYGKGQLYLK